jgi:hypothetical protein
MTPLAQILAIFRINNIEILNGGLNLNYQFAVRGKFICPAILLFS